jgi:hypothetical protein
MVKNTAFMQAVYNYIPETNRVSKVHSVAVIMLLQFVLRLMLSILNVLHFNISTFRSLCSVHNMAVCW